MRRFASTWEVSETFVKRRRVEFASRHLAREGPVVVALHCSGSSYKQWSSLAVALENSGGFSRLVAPNLFGSGRTEPWRGGEQTLDDQAALVRACVDEPCLIVGHSHGGSVAIRCGDLALGLVLFEPNHFFLLGQDLDALTFVHRMRAAAEADDRDEWGRLFWDFWFRQSDDDVWDDLAPDLKRKLVDPTLPHTYHEITSLLLAMGPGVERDLVVLDALGDKVHLLLSPEPGLGFRPVLARYRRLFATLGAQVFDAPVGGHVAPITHPDPTAAFVASHLLSLLK
ncbi:hypothetical protein CTAYLR_007957 [Chrysophaeum taylorii]|uniref:AB hydrolase-1 domain-containing protein n=1 Tax=Chrysophaeum taylorii TaxID=2483200 RepID=A0AAD7XIU9_9STRA|nr:hypothetical protein CTAYLR_007957 [Chrysophaeum taylorii]